MNEDNNDQTKVPDEFISRSVSLVYLVPFSMSKLIHSRCTVDVHESLSLNLGLHTCMHTVLFLCFSPLFCSS